MVNDDKDEVVVLLIRKANNPLTITRIIAEILGSRYIVAEKMVYTSRGLPPLDSHGILSYAIIVIIAMLNVV